MILDTVNCFDEHIKFTIERETDRAVLFLDTHVVREENNIIKLDWHRKASAASKMNFIRQMKHRIQNICQSDYVGKNLKTLQNLLTNNGYPKSLV